MSLSKYLITDPSYYSYEQSVFTTTLTDAFIKYKPDFACFRYKSDFANKEELAKKFIDISANHGVKSIINSSIEIASNMGAFGVHLPSNMLSSIGLAKAHRLCVFASAHTLDEASYCETKGADFITLSPVFASPNKGQPLGVERFGEMILELNIKVFALGGIITDEQIKAVASSGAYGFASIRYFVE